MPDMSLAEGGENVASNPLQQDESGFKNVARVLSASRLIADRTVLKCILDVLDEPLETSNDGFASLDDLYFAVRFFDSSAGEEMNGLAETIQCDKPPTCTESNRPNGWRYLWMFRIGDCSIRLGIGWIEFSGKTHMQRGFVQFNPNKARGRREIELLLRKVGRFARDVELKRYDIAIDIPVQRELVRFRKDNRGYEYIDHGNGLTEYLGTRNKPGRVKLYDKTREAKLDKPWTRLELTADASWDADRIVFEFPNVYAWRDSNDSDETTRNWVIAFGLLATDYLENSGGTIEPYLRILGKKSSDKIMAFMASPHVEIEREIVEQLRQRALAWQERFYG